MMKKRITTKGMNSKTPDYAKGGSGGGRPSTDRFKASRKNPAQSSRLGV